MVRSSHSATPNVVFHASLDSGLSYEHNKDTDSPKLALLTLIKLIQARLQTLDDACDPTARAVHLDVILVARSIGKLWSPDHNSPDMTTRSSVRREPGAWSGERSRETAKSLAQALVRLVISVCI